MKAPVVSGKEMINFLARRGFMIVGRNASHVLSTKFVEHRNLVVIVPDLKEFA